MVFDSAIKNFKDKSQVNPYRFCIYQLWNRLRWDFRLKSIVERRKIRSLRDAHAGKKAIILCNGPSLNEVDFELLDGCYVFGLNKINLLFSRTKFRPDCVVTTNMHVVEQNSEFFNATDIKLFFDCKAYIKRLIRPRESMTFFHSSLTPGFAKDCSVSINPSHTVTNTALQLAYHMGFSKVAIVGADHNFAVKGEPNSRISGVKEDHSHFDPTYFANVEWQLPDLTESEVGYLRAKYNYESTGRLLYNCTVGGKLEIFERMELKDFVRL
jgi:hypothetical protein